MGTITEAITAAMANIGPGVASAKIASRVVKSLSWDLKQRVGAAVTAHVNQMIPTAVDHAKALMAKGETAEKAVEEAVKDIFRRTYTGKLSGGLKKIFKRG